MDRQMHHHDPVTRWAVVDRGDGAFDTLTPAQSEGRDVVEWVDGGFFEAEKRARQLSEARGCVYRTDNTLMLPDEAAEFCSDLGITLDELREYCRLTERELFDIAKANGFSSVGLRAWAEICRNRQAHEGTHGR